MSLFLQKIIGSLKWLLATGASVAGAVYVDNPIAKMALEIISFITASGTIATIIPNQYWTPIFRFIGRKISQYGRKRFGLTKWETIEDHMQSGSFWSFVAMAAKEIANGMNEDDVTSKRTFGK